MLEPSQVSVSPLVFEPVAVDLASANFCGPMDKTDRLSGSSPRDFHAGSDPGWIGAPALVAERIGKLQAKQARDLTGISLRVAQGEVLGVLGPDGSGKSTLLRILATLLPADTGRLTILGFDALGDAAKLRRRVGWLGESNGLDPLLTGRENLKLRARLHGIRQREAASRADEMLTLFELSSIGTNRVQRYPESAARRLAIACSLVHRPRLVLWNEPALNLSGEDCVLLWRILKMLRDNNIAVIVAGKDLDDAEALCQRIAILDEGRIIAFGTSGELKAQVSGVTISIALRNSAQCPAAATLVEHMSGVGAVWLRGERIDLEAGGAALVPAILRVLEEYDIETRSIAVNKPSLDEVFLRQTGRKLRDSREVRVSGTSVSGRI